MDRASDQQIETKLFEDILILAVDDEPAIQKLIGRTLEDVGYQIDLASNGLEALKFLKKKDYDLVITDVAMPEMDGVRLVKEIQKHFTADVIVITGLLETYQFDKFIPLGARDFIPKPINVDELKLRVDRILKERSLKEKLICFHKELAHAQKLESIGQLASGIAHEINTPVQYIGDNTDFIKQSLADLFALINEVKTFMETCDDLPGKQLKDARKNILSKFEAADIDYLAEEIPLAIQSTLEGVKRVSGIVRSMKEFSHPGIKEKVLTDLHHCIENTVIVSKNEWKYCAALKLDIDPQLPKVKCNPGEINQVLLNMIINASHAISDKIKADPSRKGIITITARKKAKWVEIRISDTGTGIPDHLKKKIFDPFFTTKEMGKGTGQGLAISHSVIEKRHKGKIRIETEEGKGTTFIIQLPYS